MSVPRGQNCLTGEIRAIDSRLFEGNSIFAQSAPLASRPNGVAFLGSHSSLRRVLAGQFVYLADRFFSDQGAFTPLEGQMTIRFSLRILFAFVASFTLLASEARAVSLAGLFQGGTITANDKVFSNFTLVNLQTTNGGVADTSMIDVTPLTNDPADPGLNFAAPLDALGTPFGHTGPSSVELKFSFDVATISQLPLIKDTSLLINQFTFDSGVLANIQVSEQVTDTSAAVLGTNLALATNMSQVGDGSLESSISFTPQAVVHVVKQIDIVGPNDNDGAFLRNFQQRFSQVVPEPGCVSLLWALVAAPGLRRAGRRRF